MRRKKHTTQTYNIKKKSKNNKNNTHIKKTKRTTPNINKKLKQNTKNTHNKICINNK